MNIAYTPQQNSIAERDNRTIVEATRSMIYSRSDIFLFILVGGSDEYRDLHYQ